MRAFLYCFLPLFVAVDAIGILPIYLSLTEGIDRRNERKIIVQSTLTALIVALLFLLAGNRLLRILGIAISDFMIAGGVTLFALALGDIIWLEKRHRRAEPEDVGPVPVGVPLIVGPAVLTTALLLVDAHGFVATSLAIVANVLLAGIMLWVSRYIAQALGKTGAKIVSKLAGLLLAAFGVMMVRRGIMEFLGT
jgi:multiple antibiotic resistance protein